MFRLDRLDLDSSLLAWVLGSVLAYALGTNAAWLLGRALGARRRGGAPVDPGALWGGWPREVARFAYYLGVPYLVLGGWPRGPLQGLISLPDMGFAAFDAGWPVTRWLDAAGTGVGLGLAVLIVLVVAWRNANLADGRLWLRFPARAWWAVAADTLYLGVHWAFYRAVAVRIAGDFYAGVFLGLAAVYVEWALNPGWRHGWRDAGTGRGTAAGQWLHAALALGMAVLFLLTRNLWVCLLVQMMIDLACRRQGRGRAGLPAAPPGTA